MTAINITEKQLDILVNGNIEDSFSQRANSANYDIDVTSTQSFEWTLEANIDISYHGNTVSTTSTVSGELFWYSYNYNYIDGNASDAMMQFRDSNGNILFEEQIESDPDNASGEDTIYLPNATEVYAEINDNYDLSVDIESATNHTRITDRVGNAYSIPTGLIVNGVTQS